MTSPLLIDGLETLIEMTVHCNNENYIQILKEKVSKISFRGRRVILAMKLMMTIM